MMLLVYLITVSSIIAREFPPDAGNEGLSATDLALGSAQQRVIKSRDFCLYSTLIRKGLSNRMYKNSNLAYIVLALLANANDVQLNSGPESSTVFPCGTCDLPVTWDDKANGFT